ncbi:MAG TPA: hypothetical protein QGG91_00885 [Flavobacteriales bacterium]|jgi:hypothetical protein|nr:hypothetical protein [Flavobacteriales bacterium]HJN63252.1 hypothetical protein [Flavobacteriales bacterium]
MKNKVFLVSMCLLFVSNVKAQDIKATEVRVTEQFVPSVPEASKLNEQATFSDTIKVDKSQKYTVSEHSLKADYKTRPLKAAKVKTETISKLYNSKVFFGTGYRIGSKATIMHNSNRSKDLNYGVLLNHFSNKYKPEGFQAKNSKNTLHLYGKKINAKHIFIANLDYDRRTALYWDKSSTFEEEQFLNNRFAYTKFTVSAISKENASNKMIRNVTFFASDLNEMSENQIHLSADLQKEINELPIDLEIEFNDYINYNNKDSKYQATEFKELHFVPKASFEKFGIRFETGLNLHYDPNGIAISPIIKATKELVKDILLVDGGIRHIEKRNTLKSLADENPFIHSYGSNQSILGEHGFMQALETTSGDELYLLMRNVLGKDEVFEGAVAYGMIDNFHNLQRVNNGDYNRFKIGYVDVKQLHLSVKYERRVSNILSVNAYADYYSWDKKVYYKPNFVANISAPINLRDKIKVEPSINYLGERYYNEISQLESQFHANLSLQYNYSKILSAFLQLNNLTNSKKELWRNYQEIGFNGVFGVSYSF